jgi:hypothetical protein
MTKVKRDDMFWDLVGYLLVGVEVRFVDFNF